MKTKIFRCLAIIFLVLSFAGCTSFELRDANQQLTSYYYAKQQAFQDDDWRMLENVRSSLKTLASDAAQQAQKEKNVLNQIAFYRIATTAAWQAEDLSVVSYADDGSKLCAGGNFDRAPRDCGMLLVIPVFAGVDETTDRFNQLQDKVLAARSDELASYATDTQKVFNAYKDGLVKILELRPKLAGSMAHPDFIKAVDENSGMLLCTHIETQAFGLITTVNEKLSQAKCEIYMLKKSAFKAGLKQSYAKCLPGSEAQLIKPQECP